LISISKLTSSLNIEVIFATNLCVIQERTSKEKIGITKTSGSLYVFDNLDAWTSSSRGCNSIDANLWHDRLGHLCDDRLGHLCDDRLAILKQKHSYIRYTKTDRCDSFQFAKQKRLPFPKNASSAIKYFDIIHVDIRGSCSIPSLYSHRYYLTIIDGYSRFTWVYLINNKAET